MKKLIFGFLVTLALVTAASAQVSVELMMDQDQFLPGESVPLAVRITNRSGRVLEMGEAPDWLSFSIDCREVSSGIVSRTKDMPVAGAFSLPSSKRAIKRVDLAPYFALLTPGRYSVVATVRIPGWDGDISSAPLHFYVVEGTRIWEREVGLPGPTTNSTPEIRKYLLQQANHLRGQPRLYLRVTDRSGLKLFKLQLIGTILSFSRPDPQVDAQSNLHLLYQNGPESFGYTVFTPNGLLILRQTYDYYGDSKPRLTTDRDDQIVVVGGQRRETKSDIPPSLAQNSVSIPSSVPTNLPQVEK